MAEMTRKPIPYGRQEITDADIAKVSEVLRGEFLTQGPSIETFEKAFANYVGSEYAVAVSNGTAALHLCAMALDVQPGQRVITSPITFAASANCVRYCGGEVWFADIDPETFILDVNEVEKLLRSKPAGFFSGIIPVDFSGMPANLEKFSKLADEFNLWIIEDACHAPGAWFTDSKGVKQKSGNGKLAELAIFSFHPVKHIASGEGGMVTTNDKAVYEKLLLLRTHGITKRTDLLKENHGGWYYEMQTLGYNYRLTDFQAALGLSQLERADKGLERRSEIAAKYDRAFAGTSLKLQAHVEGAFNAHHLYIIQSENRKTLYDYLRTKSIFTQVHYIPVHTMPYYRELEKTRLSFTHAEAYYARCLSLPMFPSLTDEEQDYVIREVLSHENA